MTSESTRQSGAKPAKRPTIYDVARLSGVSPSTVSRALSTPGRISAATEARILEAARSLDFRANPAARTLQTGRSNTLGLLVADITNPMFSELVRGAERAADECGYTLFISETRESGGRELGAAERIMRSTDGVILASTRMHEAEIISLAERTPTVVVNRAVQGVSSVTANISTGIFQAVAHLSALGHVNVAYLAGPDRSEMSQERDRVLRDAAARRGMLVETIGPNAPTREAGAALLPRIVASKATAFFAYNDVMAIGLLLAAQGVHLPIPGRLSIVGFDDIFGADFTSPPLTTVRTPLAQLGELAVRQIVALSDQGVSPPRVGPPLETSLVLRGSTGPLPEGRQ